MPPRTGSSRRRHTSLESFDTAALHRFSRVGRFTALRKTWEKRCSARVNPNASPDGKHASQVAMCLACSFSGLLVCAE